MIPMRFLVPAVLAVTLTVVAGIAMVRGEEPAHGIEVVSAWARATPPGASVGAAYLTLRNRGSEDDRLLGVESAAAARIELHETVEEGGVAKMRPVKPPAILAGEALEMRPGGIHLMLMDLAAPLKEGMSVPLTLTLEVAGAISVEAEVAPLGADAAPSEHSM
jgi:periplasmic copper chaperone A